MLNTFPPVFLLKKLKAFMKNKVWSETSLPISFSACTFQKNVSHVTFYDGAKFFFCLPHCVKSGQIRSVFWSVFSLNAGKCGPEITPYLDTFHAVVVFFVVIIYLPVCYHSVTSLHIKPFSYMMKKSGQKLKYLNNEKCF